MDQFTNHSRFYNKAILLAPEQQERPLEVMQEFFDCFSLSEVRQVLWKMIHTAMSTENYFFQEYDQRDSLLLFYEGLEKFMEAGLLLTAREDAGISCEHST